MLLVRKAIQAHKVMLVLTGLKVTLDRKALKELRELQALTLLLLVPPARKGLLVTLALLVQLVLKVPKGILALQVPKDLKAIQVTLAHRVLRVIQAPKVQQAQQDQPVPHPMTLVL